MKMLTDVIAELAMVLKEHGDMAVVVQCTTSRRPEGMPQNGYVAQEVRRESVYKIDEPMPGSFGKVVLRGVNDEEGSELTCGGLRLDGREAVVVISG